MYITQWKGFLFNASGALLNFWYYIVNVWILVSCGVVDILGARCTPDSFRHSTFAVVATATAQSQHVITNERVRRAFLGNGGERRKRRTAGFFTGDDHSCLERVGIWRRALYTSLWSHDSRRRRRKGPKRFQFTVLETIKGFKRDVFFFYCVSCAAATTR